MNKERCIYEIVVVVVSFRIDKEKHLSQNTRTSFSVYFGLFSRRDFILKYSRFNRERVKNDREGEETQRETDRQRRKKERKRERENERRARERENSERKREKVEE